MEKSYTISVFTENYIGMLSRVTILFTRRHLNIESITASESEVSGIYRYTIVLQATLQQAQRVVKQIEKLVDVLIAFVHEDTEIVHQEIALYKVKTNAFSGAQLERIIRQNHARILTVEPEFMVIEKTGHKPETQNLFYELEPFGVLEFARSGNVAVTKPMKELAEYLKEKQMW